MSRRLCNNLLDFYNLFCLCCIVMSRDPLLIKFSGWLIPLDFIYIKKKLNSGTTKINFSAICHWMGR